MLCAEVIIISKLALPARTKAVRDESTDTEKSEGAKKRRGMKKKNRSEKKKRSLCDGQ